MKTPLHRDSRLDELDAEQFERMLASKSWQIYTERLALEWGRLSSRCITEKEDSETRPGPPPGAHGEAGARVRPPQLALHHRKGGHRAPAGTGRRSGFPIADEVS